MGLEVAGGGSQVELAHAWGMAGDAWRCLGGALGGMLKASRWDAQEILGDVCCCSWVHGGLHGRMLKASRWDAPEVLEVLGGDEEGRAVMQWSASSTCWHAAPGAAGPTPNHRTPKGSEELQTRER